MEESKTDYVALKTESSRSKPTKRPKKVSPWIKCIMIFVFITIIAIIVAIMYIAIKNRAKR